MKTKIYILLLAFCTVLPFARAQVVSSLYFMDNLPQSSILNPAFTPNYNFYFGIPVVNNVNIHFGSDIGLGDIYSDGQYVWNNYEGLYKPFLKSLAKTSYLTTELNTSIFNMGFRTKKGFIHIAINTRADFKFGIPKDLFKVNDLSIGHDFSGSGIKAQLFNEFAFGYSHQISDKLSVGGKIKYLNGLTSASLEFDQFDLTTTEAAWAYDVVGTINKSGPFEIDKDDEGFPSGISSDEDFENLGRVFDLLFAKGGNSGIGIDLGAEYEVIPRLKLSASVIDLGKINWRKDVENINFTANYEFTGIHDPVSSDNGTSIDVNEDALDDIIDDIKDSYDSPSSSADAFSYSLSPKLFLGAEYELTQSLSLGVVSRTHFIEQEKRQNFIFAANANLKRILTLGANYNIGVDNQNSYGGVLGLRIFPFYIYFAADVIPGYAPGGSSITFADQDPLEIPVSMPANLSSFNFQVGINIAIGERRRQLSKRAKRSATPLFEEELGTSSFDYPF